VLLGGKGEKQFKRSSNRSKDLTESYVSSVDVG
jgi:hypothetical protein